MDNFDLQYKHIQFNGADNMNGGLWFWYTILQVGGTW